MRIIYTHHKAPRLGYGYDEEMGEAHEIFSRTKGINLRSRNVVYS